MPDIPESELALVLSELKSITYEMVNSLEDKPAALGYSGGVDSSILAAILGDSRKNITLATLGRPNSSDIESATQSLQPNIKRFRIVISHIERDDIEVAAKKMTSIVSVSNISHFEDCIAFWLLARKTREFPEIDYLISANGPDELFCGYDRFRRILDSADYEAIEKEIPNALKMAQNLGEQVKKISSEFGYQIREPFLNEKFKQFALKIPVRYKILPNNDLLRKRIWRCFGREIGLPEAVVKKPKKAMQYGMGIHPVITNLIRRGNIKPEFRLEQKNNQNLSSMEFREIGSLKKFSR